jgi:TetR/AcrR family transcriptional repressor of nem operon
MKVSKEQSARNRQTLVETAARLFRERGFDGVGVKEISQTAGLTQGAFYAHFESKEALATEANHYLQQESQRQFLALKGASSDDLKAYIDFYISEANRDGPLGCPMAAYAGEICRQGDELQEMFTEGLEGMVNAVQVTLPAELTPDEARRRALTITTTMIGAVMLARASRSVHSLSDEILSAIKQELLSNRYIA